MTPGVLELAGEANLSAEEGGSKFRDQFFCRVVLAPEAAGQFPA